MLHSAVDPQSWELSPDWFRGGENLTPSSKKKSVKNAISVQDLPSKSAINDIDSYATKARTNLVDNNPGIVPNQWFDSRISDIMPDSIIEDGMLYPTKIESEIQDEDDKVDQEIDRISQFSKIMDFRQNEITKSMSFLNLEDDLLPVQPKLQNNQSYVIIKNSAKDNKKVKSPKKRSKEKRTKWKDFSKDMAQSSKVIGLPLQDQVSSGSEGNKSHKSSKKTSKKRKLDLKKKSSTANHKQTVEHLKHTIKARDRKIKMLESSVELYKGKVNTQAKYAKAFDIICNKLKDRLENSSNITKKINQWSMFLLSFYKEFEEFVGDVGERLDSKGNDKCVNLSEQLGVWLKLLDTEPSYQENVEVKAIFQEFEKLSSNFIQACEGSSNLFLKKHSLSFSKISADDNINLESCINENKTLDLPSPMSSSNHNSRHDLSASFTWTLPATDFESSSKDIFRLAEENKYLRKRLPHTISTSGNFNPKCVMCSNYIDIIDALRREKCESSKEIGGTPHNEEETSHTAKQELDQVKSKYQDQSKNLTNELEQEGSLIARVNFLENKNKELTQHIQNVLEKKDGIETIQNTVTDLSLALISKNEQELTYRQKTLIKDLFASSQIKAISMLKERWESLEKDHSRVFKIAKNYTEKNQHLLETIKRYSIGMNECIDLYRFIDIEFASFGTDAQHRYFVKHVTGFLKTYEADIRKLLPKIDIFLKEAHNDILDIKRQSDELDVENYDEMVDSNIWNKPPNLTNVQSKHDFYLNSETNVLDGDTKIQRFEDNNSLQIWPPPVDVSFSKEDNSALLNSVDSKDSKVTKHKRRLKSDKSTSKKKSKKKGSKVSKKVSKHQDMSEVMIEDTIEELQSLIDEKEDLDDYIAEYPAPKESILDQYIADTIKEADEKDEEGTLFDRNGHALPLRSATKDLKAPDLLEASQQQIKYEIKGVNEKIHETTSEKERSSREDDMLNDSDLSIDSESVKLDEDELNDSIKIDEN